MSVVTIKGMSPKLSGTGCPVTVTGSGFAVTDKIICGGVTVEPQEITDTEIVFSAPYEEGSYVVTVRDGDDDSAEMSLIVVSIDSIPVKIPQLRTNENFRDAALGLMPRGFAWFRGLTGNFAKFFLGIGFAFAYVNSLVRNLVAEMRASHALTLSEWEAELGLPKKGLAFNSDKDRRAEIYRNECRVGGSTVPYLQSIDNLFGIKSDIIEYWKAPERFPSWVTALGSDALMYWAVNLYTMESDVKYFTCQSTCDDYLAYWWNEPIESFLSIIKPAHTKVIFLYTIVSNVYTAVSSSDGSVVSGDSGEVYIYG